MITVVGHTDLEPESLALVEWRLRQELDDLPEGVGGLVRAAAGTALAFGRATAASGRKLTAVLPARDGLIAPLPARDSDAARELLRLCQSARLQPYDPADRSSRITLDEQLVAESTHVLAVWDGSPTDGRDATAHLVAYARARGVPVRVLWPHGAARTAAGTAARTCGRPGPNGPMTAAPRSLTMNSPGVLRPLPASPAAP